MTYQQERDEAIAILTAEGMPLPTIRTLFRLSQTLHRLAVAQCNGDWPADNGERKVVECADCGGGWAPTTLKRSVSLDVSRGYPAKGPDHYRYCPDCHASEQVKVLLEEANTARYPGRDWHNEGLPAFGPIFAGDPRGCVLKVRVPSGRTNDSEREGVCIPVRER